MILTLLLVALITAASLSADNHLMIQLDMHPSTSYIRWLEQQLDRIDDTNSEEEIPHNRGLRHNHRRLIAAHLQQAIEHMQGNSAAYAPFFELSMDIIIPSENDNDDHRRLKQTLQEHNDAVQEQNERYRQLSRYERAFQQERRITMLLSDFATASTTSNANSIASLNGTKWQAVPQESPFLPPKKRQLKCSKLDDVCETFSACLRGDEVDTAQLIKACRAHLIFMKSGGSSLRLVAKDLESNLQKAERPFKKSPNQGKTLSSLLESEREAGIHQGSILKEQSAAMGLLWIRRSLSFQLELYSSLFDQDGQHPRDAAYEAYTKILSPFHGWALRKLFPASLSQMPDRQAFIAKFGGVSLDELNEEYDREVVDRLKSLVAAWNPLISTTWEKDFARLNLEDTRRV